METYKLTVKIVKVHTGTEQTKQNVRERKWKWKIKRKKIFRRDPQFFSVQKNGFYLLKRWEIN